MCVRHFSRGISTDNCDSKHLNLITGEGKHDRKAVINARITVDNYFFSHNKLFLSFAQKSAKKALPSHEFEHLKNYSENSALKKERFISLVFYTGRVSNQ